VLTAFAFRCRAGDQEVSGDIRAGGRRIMSSVLESLRWGCRRSGGVDGDVRDWVDVTVGSGNSLNLVRSLLESQGSVR